MFLECKETRKRYLWQSSAHKGWMWFTFRANPHFKPEQIRISFDDIDQMILELQETKRLAQQHKTNRTSNKFELMEKELAG
jgi:hypothetical protein